MGHKLYMDIKTSKYIEYDPDQLSETILYFCWQKLKLFDHNNLPEIYIEIGTKKTEKLKYNGYFDVIGDDLAHICLSTKELKTDKYKYKDRLKSLFQVFLHEFYHMHTCIETYLESDKLMSLYDWQHERYVNHQQECKSMTDSGIDEDLAYWYSKEEMAAEAFAFENLSYIENLYGYGGLVTPPDAI
jgi:hypothetical protein